MYTESNTQTVLSCSAASTKATTFLSSQNEISNFATPEVRDGLVLQHLEEKKIDLRLSTRLDNYSYRILALGFPLLTIGILSGAVWANEAWGSYWSWDPKETWALITWLV